MSKLYNTKFKPTKAGLVQAAVDFVIRKIPSKKKVSPDIKSVNPTKDVKGSVKRTKKDQYSKNIGDLDKAQKKITEGKKLVKEGQKSRKQMVGTKRAFQFKGLKSYHAVEPGSKRIDPASIKQEKTKRFYTGKELEQQDFFNKGKGRAKKMGGGMAGRRMGYAMGQSVKPVAKKIKKLMDESKAKKQDAARVKFDAKKSDLDKSGDLSKYEKRRGMAIAKAMSKKNKKII